MEFEKMFEQLTADEDDDDDEDFGFGEKGLLWSPFKFFLVKLRQVPMIC